MQHLLWGGPAQLRGPVQKDGAPHPQHRRCANSGEPQQEAGHRGHDPPPQTL